MSKAQSFFGQDKINCPKCFAEVDNNGSEFYDFSARADWACTECNYHFSTWYKISCVEFGDYEIDLEEGEN